MWNYFKIILTLPIALLSFLIASFWFESSEDKTIISNVKTPILLIHGSSSNQKQWFFFHRFLQGSKTGHVFSLNLNKKPMKNDHDCNLQMYAIKVDKKLIEMQKLYAKHGLNMNQVIMVGNSLGGLVAAAYCTSNEIESKVTINALITISTPWYGSWIADYFCDQHIAPAKYFRTQSVEREQLVQNVLKLIDENKLKVFNYGSTCDPLVSSQSACFKTSNCNFTLIDDKNDHWTTMLDYNLATRIQDTWIVSHTSSLISCD